LLSPMAVTVVYAGFSLPETLEGVPLILAGQAPSASSLHTHVGSNTIDRRPVAVAVGGGYSDDDYKKLRDACIKACGSKRPLGAAFFRADNAITDRLFAEGKGPQKRTDGYAAAITERWKAKLAEVGVENGLQQEDIGELFLY
jgi:hypothetical protein